LVYLRGTGYSLGVMVVALKVEEEEEEVELMKVGEEH
jgi:hypothetical protein